MTKEELQNSADECISCADWDVSERIKSKLLNTMSRERLIDYMLKNNYNVIMCHPKHFNLIENLIKRNKKRGFVTLGLITLFYFEHNIYVLTANQISEDNIYFTENFENETKDNFVNSYVGCNSGDLEEDDFIQPRAYTKEEMRDRFIDHLKSMIEFQLYSKNKTEKEKLEGIVYSFCTLIDGVSSGFPCVDLVMRPHSSDKNYHIENGENWIEDGMVINDDVYLHDIIKFRK